jgi:hypothetical protein
MQKLREFLLGLATSALGLALIPLFLFSVPLSVITVIRFTGWDWWGALIAVVVGGMIPIVGWIAYVIATLLGVYYIVDADFEWRVAVRPESANIAPSDPSAQLFTISERINAAHILIAFHEVQEAIRISDRTTGAGTMAPEDLKLMIENYESALFNARIVTDEVLDKVHPDMRSHWRDELEAGLQLRLTKFQEGNIQAETEGSALLYRFGEWWNDNRGSMRAPQ